MTELLHNVEETENLDTSTEEAKNAEDISFNTEEMFSAGVNPEKLTPAEKEKYLELNRRFDTLKKRILKMQSSKWVNKNKNLVAVSSNNQESRISIRNLKNWRMSTVYPFVERFNRLPTLPELVVREGGSDKVRDQFLTAKEYEDVLKKCENMLDEIESEMRKGSNIISPNLQMNKNG